jgi:hypothetical protein
LNQLAWVDFKSRRDELPAGPLLQHHEYAGEAIGSSNKDRDRAGRDHPVQRTRVFSYNGPVWPGAARPHPSREAERATNFVTLPDQARQLGRLKRLAAKPGIAYVIVFCLFRHWNRF